MGAKSDDAVGLASREIDAHAEPVIEGRALDRQRVIVVVIQERPAAIHLGQLGVGQERSATRQAELVQRVSRVNADGKGLGRYLQVERASIPGGDLVEARRGIGDDTREHVEPARGALGIASSAHRGW